MINHIITCDRCYEWGATAKDVRYARKVLAEKGWEVNLFNGEGPALDICPKCIAKTMNLTPEETT